MLVTDANGDGMNDIIIGSDHGYGLAWYEQTSEGGKRRFRKHWIETDFPTFHTMALADLDGDGTLEILVLTIDHGLDIFEVPDSSCNCTPDGADPDLYCGPWPTGRGNYLRNGRGPGQ